MSPREVIAEAAGRAHFARIQSGRLDAGRKRPDGGRWQWDDVTEDGKRSYIAFTAPIADAVLTALAGLLEDEEIELAVAKRLLDERHHRWQPTHQGECITDARAALAVLRGWMLGGER